MDHHVNSLIPWTMVSRVDEWTIETPQVVPAWLATLADLPTAARSALMARPMKGFARWFAGPSWRLKLIFVPIDSTWMRRSLASGSRAGLPTPAEPERVAPASASRSGPVPRVGAPERRW